MFHFVTSSLASLPTFSRLPTLPVNVPDVVQAIGQEGIGAILHVERAVQTDVGRPGAETFHLDRSSGAIEEDDRVAELFDAEVNRSSF